MRSATFSINSQSRLGKFNVRNRDISVLIKIREHFKMFILNFQHFLVALKKKRFSQFLYTHKIYRNMEMERARRGANNPPVDRLAGLICRPVRDPRSKY